MNNSVNTMFLLTLSLVATTTFAKDTGLPHVDAINLVANKQIDVISKIQNVDLQHDTDLHEWSVKRPFAPGYIDSTNLFIVTYKVEGKVGLSWYVDTKTEKVTRIESAN